MPRDVKAFESPCRATARMLKLATSTHSIWFLVIVIAFFFPVSRPRLTCAFATRAVTTSHFKLCTRTSEIQCILLASHSSAGPYIDGRQSPFLHHLLAVTYLHSCGSVIRISVSTISKLNPSSISSHLKYIMGLLLVLSLSSRMVLNRDSPQVSSAGIGLTDLNRKTHSSDLSLRHSILDLL
jgi:hypothetical protein